MFLLIPWDSLLQPLGSTLEPPGILGPHEGSFGRPGDPFGSPLAPQEALWELLAASWDPLETPLVCPICSQTEARGTRRDAEGMPGEPKGIQKAVWEPALETPGAIQAKDKF